MAIARWRPLEELRDLQREMDRLFARAFGREHVLPTFARAEVFYPDVDVYRRGDNLVVRVDLPGVRPQDVDITVSDNLLTIKGERSYEEIKDEDTYVREICPGKFERMITLPEAVKVDQAKATFENGMLELTATLAEVRAPKRVKVEVKEISKAA